MNATVIVKDGGIHIITGPGEKCECGIDKNGGARFCQDIVQDMVNRHIGEYADGAVPPGSAVTVDLGEDSVASPSDADSPSQSPS